MIRSHYLASECHGGESAGDNPFPWDSSPIFSLMVRSRSVVSDSICRLPF